MRTTDHGVLTDIHRGLVYTCLLREGCLTPKSLLSSLGHCNAWGVWRGREGEEQERPGLLLGGFGHAHYPPSPRPFILR